MQSSKQKRVRVSCGRDTLGVCSLLAIALLNACSSAPTEYHSTRVVSQLTPELAPIVQANNDFSWTLYGSLARSSAANNLFFSPFSIYTALGMTYAGAAGGTASEMRTVLNIQGSDAAFHSALGGLASDLGGAHGGRDYELYLANGLFGDEGYPFSPAFVDVLGNDYHAKLQSVPFTSDPESARQSINTWLNSETQNTLPDLFPAGSFADGLTRLVLANAIYFKADWASGFDVTETAPAPFHAAGGDQSVPMMHQTGTFALSGDLDTTLLELDYRDDELSMVLLVPTAVDGLSVLESHLDRAYIDGLLAQEYSTQTVLNMPRFDLHTQFSLAATLSALGMPTAFDRSGADFSGISDANGLEPLFLADVLHAAYVQVDERGTVAAAATAVQVERDRGSVAQELTVDHPFVFLIRDKLTGAVLFVGRVTDPG